MGWDEMGWAALVTQCILMKAFTHKLLCAVLRGTGKNPSRVFTSMLVQTRAALYQILPNFSWLPSHPIPAQYVCECRIRNEEYSYTAVNSI